MRGALEAFCMQAQTGFACVIIATTMTGTKMRLSQRSLRNCFSVFDFCFHQVSLCR